MRFAEGPRCEGALVWSTPIEPRLALNSELVEAIVSNFENIRSPLAREATQARGSRSSRVQDVRASSTVFVCELRSTFYRDSAT